VCVYMLPYMHAEVIHVYVYMVTYIHRESTRGCVEMSIYTPSVNMCVYLFAFIGTEFKQTYGCACTYM